MKNIEEYPDFNPKNNLNSSSFVKDNLYRLSQLFDVDEGELCLRISEKKRWRRNRTT